MWSMLLYAHIGAGALRNSLRADRRSRIAIGVFVVAGRVVTLMPAAQPAGGQRLLPVLVAALLAYLAWER